MIRAGFIALCALLATLIAIANAPISLVTRFIPANAQPWVRVHQLEGTLWRGRAQLSVPRALPAPQSVEWGCSPSIMMVAIACELNGAIEGKAVIRPFAQRVELEQMTTTQSLLISPNSALSVSASPLTLTVARASLSQQSVAIEASAVAKQANWRSVAQPLELGEVSLDCKPADAQNTDCIIRNRAAPTTLDGRITLNAKQVNGYVDYAANGKLKQRLSI